MVSENNGGEGIHYMVVEIVVTILSWTGLATPVVRRDTYFVQYYISSLADTINGIYDK